MVFVTRFFLAWLLARVFLLVFRISPSQGLYVRFRVPRLVSFGSESFTSIHTGNLEEVGILFRDGRSSPLDAEASSGRTSLMVRLGP